MADRNPMLEDMARKTLPTGGVKPVPTGTVGATLPRFDVAADGRINAVDPVPGGAGSVLYSPGGVAGLVNDITAQATEDKAVASKLAKRFLAGGAAVGRIATVRPMAINTVAAGLGTAPAAAVPARPNDAFLVGESEAAQVVFSPLTVRLWSRGSGGLYGSKTGGKEILNAAENVDMSLLVGTYILTFKLSKTDALPFLAIGKEIPFTIEGKRAAIEKAKYDPAAGTLKIQVRIDENPIPILVGIIAAAGAVGLGGWGLSEALDSVDKVMNTSTTLLLLGGAGYLAWRFLLKGRG